MSAGAGPVAGNELFTLFPSLLWFAVLDEASRDAAGTMVDTATAHGGRIDLHRRKALAPLVELFVAESRAALARLRVDHGPLEVVSCEAEVVCDARPRPFTAIANAYLAGVYVAHASDAGCAIEFEDPRAQAHLLAPPRTTEAVPDAAVARITREAGNLVLFPAFLRHRACAPGGGPCTLITLGLLFGRFADTVARPKWRGDAA